MQELGQGGDEWLEGTSIFWVQGCCALLAIQVIDLEFSTPVQLLWSIQVWGETLVVWGLATLQRKYKQQINKIEIIFFLKG